jgi:hypothetical protein
VCQEVVHGSLLAAKTSIAGLPNFSQALSDFILNIIATTSISFVSHTSPMTAYT